jgi:molybdenum ABC transporter molybdate-binding protein
LQRAISGSELPVRIVGTRTFSGKAAADLGFTRDRQSMSTKSAARRKRRPSSAWLAFLATALAAFIALFPAAASARDLVVYGEPTLERALKSVGTLWQARSGTRVNVFAAPTELSYAQIERGARCDVIFALAGAATIEAAQRNIIHDGTAVRMLRNALVLIATADAQLAAASAPADIARLIAGKTVAIADPERDVGGAHAADFLQKIGVAVDGADKTVLVAESSAGVVSFLSTGKAELGIVYASDTTTGWKLMVPLPASNQPPIEYIVAVARRPQLDTQPFLTFLRSAPAKATFKSAGLELIGE